MSGQSTTTHRCSKCGLTKPVGEFPLRKSRRDTPSSWCRSCTNAQRRERRPELHPRDTDNSLFEEHFHSDAARAIRRAYADVADFPGYRVGNDGSMWSCWRRAGLGKWELGPV